MEGACQMKPSTTVNKWGKGIIIMLWLLLWQIVYQIVGKEVLLPSPLYTIETLFQMMQTLSFYRHILWTLQRVVIGVSISLLLAGVTSLISYQSQWVEAFLKPAVILMKSTPVMAIIILALLWFKSNEVPIFVCFLMCYPIIYTNNLSGLKHLDKELVEMTHLYQVKWQVALRKCYLPQLRPYLYAALELGLGMAFKVVIAAEVLAVPKEAIGYQLLEAKIYLETSEVFAWVITIVLLSQLSEWLLHQLLKKRCIK